MSEIDTIRLTFDPMPLIWADLNGDTALREFLIQNIDAVLKWAKAHAVEVELVPEVPQS